MLGQQLSGVNIMIFYALTLFNTIGSGELTGNEQTLVVGAVQILASLLAAFLVDLLGRRILLTVSTLLMGLSLMLLGKVSVLPVSALFKKYRPSRFAIFACFRISSMKFGT